MSGVNMESEPVQVVYDKQCPVCHAYCRLVESPLGADRVTLIDARDDSELMAEITRRGLDIDQGMVVRTGDELYYGADAIVQLARLGPGNRMFDRINRLLFKQPRLAHVCYPLMRSVRNVLLKILRVDKINNLGRPGVGKF